MATLPEPRRYPPMPRVKFRSATISCSSCGAPVHPDERRCTWCTSVPPQPAELTSMSGAGEYNLTGRAVRVFTTAGIMTPREARAEFTLKDLSQPHRYEDLASGEGD